MLRFVSRDSPQPLVTHVFSITIDRDSLTSSAQQLFPGGESDQALLKSVPLFAYPHPSAVESQCFFNFVIGDTACEFRMGFVRYQTSFSAMCILTSFYYPDLFRALLALRELDLLAAVEEMAKPELRSEYLLGDRVFQLDGSRERQSHLALLFHSFAPFDLAKIVIGMLQARHIYVISSSAAVCSQMVAAIPLLIEPFRWDMNCIPVLPMKLKEAAQVPVPTLIGLTHAEVLLEGRVENRILVNADLRMVIERPGLHLTSPHRFRIIETQTAFHRQAISLLNGFQGSNGFPHKHILSLIGSFIFQYIRIFTGTVTTIDQFLSQLVKLPEYLESSQVIQDLKNLSIAPDPVRQRFEVWLNEVIAPKGGRGGRPAASGSPIRQSEQRLMTQASSLSSLNQKAESLFSDSLLERPVKPVQKTVPNSAHDLMDIWADFPVSPAARLVEPPGDAMSDLFPVAPKVTTPPRTGGPSPPAKPPPADQGLDALIFF
jgi:hypothetical protein